MTEAIIIKAINDTCHSGRRAFGVFDDWLDIALAALKAMPRHAESVKTTGAPAEDTAEVQAMYERLRTVYSRDDFARFVAAFHALMDEAQRRGWGGHGGTWDVLGSVYMQIDAANERSGQYFTPWEICRLMAFATLEDVESDCRARIASAINRGPWGAMGMANGEHIVRAGNEQTMLYALAHNYKHLDPLLISDVACGSGSMLLAAAAACPRWALDYNIVQFFGQDIDRTCVKMARINMMLYGLNGYSLRLNAALAGVTPLPATIHQAAPDAPAPVAATVTLPPARAEQRSLFA